MNYTIYMYSIAMVDLIIPQVLVARYFFLKILHCKYVYNLYGQVQDTKSPIVFDDTFAILH